jgi:hypothetical protein
VSVSRNGTVSIAPLNNWNGKATVWVKVSDGLASNVSTFEVNVNPVNDPPELMLPEELLAYEDYPFSYQVKGADVDGDSIVFSDDSDLIDIDPNSGTIFLTPLQEHVESSPYIVTITVTDSQGAFSSNVTSFIVENTPDPPTIIGLKDQEVEVGATLSFKLMATDPDGHALEYSLKFPLNFKRNESDIIDHSTGEVEFRPRSNDVGKYKVKATVTDPTGLQDNGTFYIIVKESSDSTMIVLSLAAAALFIAMIIAAFVQKRMRRL